MTIAATIAFYMGMNVRDIIDVVNPGLPASMDTKHRQEGRAGRDPTLRAQGHTYVKSGILNAVREVRLVGVYVGWQKARSCLLDA